VRQTKFGREALVQEPEREIRREALLEELNRRVLGDLDLGSEKQCTTRCCTRTEKQPQPVEQQALHLIRRQSLELSRSHRTPSYAAIVLPGAVSA